MNCKLREKSLIKIRTKCTFKWNSSYLFSCFSNDSECCKRERTRFHCANVQVVLRTSEEPWLLPPVDWAVNNSCCKEKRTAVLLGRSSARHAELRLSWAILKKDAIWKKLFTRTISKALCLIAWKAWNKGTTLLREEKLSEGLLTTFCKDWLAMPCIVFGHKSLPNSRLYLSTLLTDTPFDK